MVGRDREAARLEALIRTATRGGSGALLVTGEPGIGKTLLLDHVRRYAEEAGCLVLGATSVEAESRLPFAGLADMLGPILSLIDRVPRPQAAALRGALALGPPVPGDRFSAYAGAFSLMAAGAEERPLVCVVDDAHWLDPESLEALVFAARRIDAEGIAIVLAARTGQAALLGTDTLPRLTLGGLAAADGARLLGERAASAADPDTAAALTLGVAGNPLALIELAQSLSPAQLAGAEPLPDPLPVGAELARALLRPLHGLPAPTLRALLVASAGDAAAGVLDAALAAEGLTRDDLRPAEGAGIVVVDETVAFAHPLLRGAVYAHAPAPDRRAAHRAHARATEAGAAGADPDRHAWHLALASAGPDEPAAAALEGAAGRAMARTAFAAATEGFETAARLSPERVDRGRRQIAAARAAFTTGAFARAGDLFDGAIALDAAPDQVFEAMAGRGASEMLGGSARRSVEMLVAAADRARPFAPPAAAALLTLATVPAIMRTDLAAADAAARDAESLAADGSPVLAAQLAVATASIATLGGTATSADPQVLATLADAGAGGDPTAGAWIVIHHQTLIWSERYEEAGAGLDALIAGLRAQGAPSALPWPLQARAQLRVRIGELDRAASDATEGLRLAQDTRQASLEGTAHATLATLDALTGRDEDARDHVAEALAAADRAEALSLRFYALAAQGLLALGRRRLDEALATYSLLDAEFRRRVDAHPLITPWEQDLVETLVRLGRADEAAGELAALDRQASRTGSAWAAAAAARCRGMLSTDLEFESDFARAMEWHARTSVPFERARTELCLGERRRRARRPGDAREPLTSALATFESMGAEPWSAWAREELAAAGATVPPAGTHRRGA